MLKKIIFGCCVSVSIVAVYLGSDNNKIVSEYTELLNEAGHTLKSFTSKVTVEENVSEPSTGWTSRNTNTSDKSFLNIGSHLNNRLPKGRIHIGDYGQQDADRRVIKLHSGDFVLDKSYVPDLDANLKVIYVEVDTDPALVSSIPEGVTDESNFRFLDAVADNVWAVAVTKQAYDDLVGYKLIKAAGEVSARDKVTTEVFEEGFRLTAEGSAEIVVSLFSEEYQDAFSTYLTSTNANVLNIRSSGEFELTADPTEVLKILELNYVQFVESGIPVNAITNENSARLSNVNDVVNNFGLTGNGVNVGVWDIADIAPHADFVRNNQSRVSLREAPITVNFGVGTYSYREYSDHSTHVAGTVGSSGNGNQAARGMATEVNLFSYNFSGDISSEIRNSGLNLTNHSYGVRCGWNRSSNGNWSDFGRSCFGNYGSLARGWDSLVLGNYNLIIVKSAGNDRDDNPAAANGNGDGQYKNGFDTISERGNAKNIITVGAANNAGTATTAFSSWGPTNDGRIKPDIVADGYGVLSTVATVSTCDNDDIRNPGSTYDTCNGTSMSTPVVTGSLALIQQRHKQLFNRNMHASYAKALLIHTAEDIRRTGPDYETGWGLLDTEAAITQLNRGQQYNGSFNTGVQCISASFIGTLCRLKPVSYTMQVGSTNELKVTTAWIAPSMSLNSTNAAIADYNLTLIAPNGNVYSPWVLNPSNPAQSATRGTNSRDNVEQVVVTNPQSGTWTVSIKPRSSSYTASISTGSPGFNMALVSNAPINF